MYLLFYKMLASVIFVCVFSVPMVKFSLNNSLHLRDTDRELYIPLWTEGIIKSKHNQMKRQMSCKLREWKV